MRESLSEITFELITKVLGWARQKLWVSEDWEERADVNGKRALEWEMGEAQWSGATRGQVSENRCPAPLLKQSSLPNCMQPLSGFHIRRGLWHDTCFHHFPKWKMVSESTGQEWLSWYLLSVHVPRDATPIMPRYKLEPIWEGPETALR